MDLISGNSPVDEEIRESALYLHDHPEMSKMEVLSSKFLSERLERRGFRVTRGVAGLDTAFIADWLPEGAGERRSEGESGITSEKSTPARPVTVAFLAEYDALPEIGHACGHNLIGASAYGAGVLLVEALKAASANAKTDPLTPVRVLVFGTPAEESGGGKVIMAEKGCFDGVDAAFYFHPGTRDSVGCPWLISQILTISFRGRSAHAATSPHQGINALSAMLVMFSSINGARQNLPRGVFMNGIIKEGGRLINIIPDFTQAEVEVRALSPVSFEQGISAVKRAAEAGALAVGAEVEIEEGLKYEGKVRIPALDSLMADVLSEMGVGAKILDDSRANASSDAGNASRRMPVGDITLSIAPRGTAFHSHEFTKYAASDKALDVAVMAAKAMAIAACRVVTDEGLRSEISRQFREGIRKVRL